MQLFAIKAGSFCIFCAECVQTCPHDNVSFNLRPFGADLAKGVQSRFDEAAMVVVMVSMTAFHGITMTPTWGALTRALEAALGGGYLVAFTLGMAGTLVLLAAAYVGLLWISSRVADPGAHLARLSVRYAYALVPVALFYHLAHNAAHLLIEAGAVVPVLSDPFVWGWDLLGTASYVPRALAPEGLIWAMQVSLVLLGCTWSLRVAGRIGAQMHATPRAISTGQPLARVESRGSRVETARRPTHVSELLPVVLAIVLYSLLSLWLLAQPMEMRTGL